MNLDNMTPEQQKAFIEMAAAVTKVAEEIIRTLGEALKPITDFYASLPDEVKQEIAARSVQEIIGKDDDVSSNNRG